MKKRSPSAARLTLTCALVALVLVPAAGADISVGVADDHAKESPEIAGRLYDTMKDVGLTENRITILWDSSHPTVIRDRDSVAHAIEEWVSLSDTEAVARTLIALATRFCA